MKQLAAEMAELLGEEWMTIAALVSFLLALATGFSGGEMQMLHASGPFL